MNSVTRVGLILVPACAAALGWFLYFDGSSPSSPLIPTTKTPASSPVHAPSPTETTPAVPTTGLPSTPATPAVGSSPAAAGIPAVAPATPTTDTIGTVTSVPASTNPQVAAVASALQTKTHPERLSALVAPAPFDAAAFAANPKAYVDDVAPARAFQTATPDERTPVLRPLSATQATARQDEAVILRVVTLPHAPVHFTSFDLGRFGNQLSAQTVVADAHGVAAVSFTAGPGTIDGVHILAGSPLASGQVAFDLTITAAQAPAAPAAPAPAPNVPAAAQAVGAGI